MASEALGLYLCKRVAAGTNHQFPSAATTSCERSPAQLDSRSRSQRKINDDTCLQPTTLPLVVDLDRPTEALLSRFPSLLHLVEPNRQQLPLEVAILTLPRPLDFQLLKVGLELVRQSSGLGVGRPGLGFEDQAPAGEEGAVDSGKEAVKTFVETVQVNPLGDGEAARWETSAPNLTAGRHEKAARESTHAQMTS